MFRNGAPEQSGLPSELQQRAGQTHPPAEGHMPRQGAIGGLHGPQWPALCPGRVGGLLSALPHGRRPRPRQSVQLRGKEKAAGGPEETGSLQQCPGKTSGVLAQPHGGWARDAEEAVQGEAVERHHAGLRRDVRSHQTEVDGESFAGQVRGRCRAGHPERFHHLCVCFALITLSLHFYVF